MIKSNFGSNVAASLGCDAEPKNAADSLGQAAETGGDLASEGSGKELVKPAAEPIVETLDPICGMSVDQSTSLRLERDGKTFYFCSERCLQTFISTIAGVKSDSKAGSCCG